MCIEDSAPAASQQQQQEEEENEEAAQPTQPHAAAEEAAIKPARRVGRAAALKEAAPTDLVQTCLSMPPQSRLANCMTVKQGPQGNLEAA